MIFDPSPYEFSLGSHRGKDVIWVAFPNDRKLIDHLRSFTKAHWSRTRRCWYVMDVIAYRKLFGLPEKSVGKLAFLKIHPVNQPAFEKYRGQIILKGYSPGTLRTYCLEFAQLLYILKSHPVVNLTPEQLRSYCLYCKEKLKLSDNQLHSRINALKFYFEQVLGREKSFFDIPRPKKPLLLPKVLSQEEVGRLFEVTANLKHRILLELCYGMGLRVSEVVRLKVKHIDSNRMQVIIAASKGKKDRYVNLPESILKLLRLYYKKYHPKDYLFEGQFGQQYSVRSAQAVFKRAMMKAGIHKRVGIHSLRHSYATHLLEYGTDITLIQKLLGHNSVKTTMLYTHVGNRTIKTVKSPLDQIRGKNKKTT